MPGPLDQLFRDVDRGIHRGDRFEVTDGLGKRRGHEEPGDDAWLLRDEDPSVAQTIAGLLGVAFQGLMAYFPLGFTFFVAPLPMIVAVYVLWGLMLRVAARQRTRHPWRVLAIPFAFAAAWAAMMWFGWTQLGWPPLRMPGLIQDQ